MTPEMGTPGFDWLARNLVSTSRACNIAARQISFVRLDAR